MSDKKRSFKRTFIGGITSVILLGVAGFLLLNQQYVTDKISVLSYQPSAAIQAIESRIDFTDKGKFYFYATQPEVDGSEKFNQDCPRQEVGNPILGCYTMGRIFIYDVTDEQLSGMEEVTAAHETLHAVWERMSPSEQARIGELLRVEYQTLGDNEDLRERMNYYQRTEPGQFENELHSILGSEVRDLNSELEAYYKKYFNDRQKVVALHGKYDAIFKSLKTQSNTLYAELTILGKSIEERSAQYEQDIAELSADIASFNARADNGSFSSIAQFNSERESLLNRSERLDNERTAISNDIETYNIKYSEYQKISIQIESLNKSIDSIKALEPTPSI